MKKKGDATDIFVEGMSRLIAPRRSRKIRVASEGSRIRVKIVDGFEQDRKNLLKDWRTVGNEMRRSMEKVSDTID